MFFFCNDTAPPHIYTYRTPLSLHHPFPFYLPRHAKPVLDPAAGLLLTAVHKGVPVAIYLGLVLAEDLERDRLVRRELRPAVQGRELDAVDLEVDEHRRAGRHGSFAHVGQRPEDLAVEHLQIGRASWRERVCQDV